MARDPLEDYAEGIGAGALPQQGSMLPLQGGLPFGASPQQAPKPMPAPSFGAIPQTPRAPLTSLGGMVPDPEQMLAERLQRFTAPAVPGISGMRDRDMLMEEIKALSSAAGVRSQDRQLQEKNLSELSKLPLEFHEKFTPEEQERVRPVFQRLIRARADLSKLPVDDALITDSLASADLAKTYADLVNDPLVGPEERQGYLSRLGGVRGEKRSAERGRVDMEIGQKALSLIQSKLPEELARLGASAQTPLDVQKFLLDPQVKQYMNQSPILKRTFNAFINDKNNAESLANLGLDVSGLKRQQQSVEGTKMTPEAEQFLGALFTGSTGKPMIPAQATSAQIKSAIDAAQKYKENALAKQGLRAAELALTMPAPAEERDQHINVTELVKSGQIVKPPQGITVGNLRKGEFRFARPEQQKALMALQPQRTAFADMNAMADRLITANTWQEGIAQGIRLHRTSRTGEDPLAAAYLKSTAAATSYLARMVESGVMTEGDVARWQSAAVSSFFDTKSARDIKRALMGDIIDSAQSSVVSQVAGVPMKEPGGLREKLDKLDALTRDTWKQTKAGLSQDEMLITDGQGQYAKIKRGSKLTESWKEVK